MQIHIRSFSDLPWRDEKILVRLKPGPVFILYYTNLQSMLVTCTKVFKGALHGRLISVYYRLRATVPKNAISVGMVQVYSDKTAT